MLRTLLLAGAVLLSVTSALAQGSASRCSLDPLFVGCNAPALNPARSNVVVGSQGDFARQFTLDQIIGLLTGGDVTSALTRSGAVLPGAVLPFGNTAGKVADGRYVRNLPIAAESLLAKCDGVTDDVTVLNTAAQSMAAAGGGTILIGGRCLIDGADLVLPKGVRFQGAGAPAGEDMTSLDYTALPSTLIVNPARTVRVNGPGALSGLIVLRKGQTAPKSMRDGLNAVTAMAGTAITLQGTASVPLFDPNLSDLLILGFDTAISGQYSSRLTLNNVRGDNRNGLKLDQAHDVPRITGAHWFPLLTVHQPWSVSQWTVTAAANNGSGAIRLTLATSAPLVTGDQVYVQTPGVLSAYAGAATVIDGTHVDLPGTSFSGALSGNGVLQVDTTRRYGTGFQVSNSENVSCVNSFAYGYTKGWYLTTGAGWTNLVNCSVDGNYSLADPSSIGVAVDGSAYGTSMVGGFISSLGAAIYVASQDIEAHSFTGVSINPPASTVQGQYIQLVSGRTLLSGNHSPSGNGAVLSVAAGVAGADIVGNTMPGTTVLFGAGAQTKTLLASNTLAVGQPLLNIPNQARTAVQVQLTDVGTLGVPSLYVGPCPEFTGAGSPQGVVTAPPCGKFNRTDGGASSTFYVKESGTGNTGWVAK